ncbi:MAG: hypothetical protein CHACPFDD_03725 [Phycisphaerae bacterium]|nr:hypothetical protein [Phycisphaerae bacterium]
MRVLRAPAGRPTSALAARRTRCGAALAAALAGAVLIAACTRGTTPPPHEPSDEPRHPGQEIIVGGKHVYVGAPVVLWTDPGGYNAYVPGPVFATSGPAGERYAPGRAWADNDPTIGFDALRTSIDKLVVHYDACGFSRRCFRILQDERVLSAHFLLDVDGTLYQTLDLRDTAWHGRSTNARSIGVEIAQIGVYSPKDRAADAHQKRRWYVREGGRLRLAIPAEFGETGIRGAGPFYAARNRPVRGRIHGTLWEQVDFTPQQYETLARLTAALRRTFPLIRLDVPRGADGRAYSGELPAATLEAFQGILGHYHITTERNDPGPAFDWERLLSDVRAIERGGLTARGP